MVWEDDSSRPQNNVGNTQRVCLSVCLSVCPSVCLLVTTVGAINADEPIQQVQFDLGGHKEPCIMWRPGFPQGKGNYLGIHHCPL